MVRVRPADSATQLFPTEVRILHEVGHGRANKHRLPYSKHIINTLHILTVLIGNLNSPYRKFGRAGLLLWLLDMAINFMYDGYESHAKYGYLWLCVRGLLWVTCCVCTWFTIKRTIPWLERGLGKLESCKHYRKALRDMACTTEVRKRLHYFTSD